MIVLGKTSDDKGTQLEHLTRKILENLGCRNIIVNLVSAGGQEIDVSADYPMPGIGSVQNRRLICECKAYAKPMNIPDWLKFLGKVYSEEAKLNSEVTGYFIALSGVNGNVSGHYDQLKIARPNISLVKGDNLLDELRKIYKLCDVEKVNEILERFTEVVLKGGTRVLLRFYSFG
jgi:Restriction endonuclease